MTFDYLSPELREVLGARGLTEPTVPQRDAGPRIARGDNVLLLAPTGIGKTEAAMLPILDAMREEGKHPGIRCLYITPLRALNRDMFRRLEDIGGDLGISVDVRHGDTSASDRNRQSLHPPDVLITTPETLQVMFTGKRLAQHMKNIRWVVVDEIHELADTERGAQLSVALERLVMLAGEFQRIGLSATVGNGEEVARFLAGVKRRVTLCRHDTHRDMDISVERPDPCDDPVLLDRLQGDPDIISVMVRARQLIEEGRSTLFFVNTRETAEWLAARFRHWDPEFPIDVHHGSLSKEVRTEMEDRFKSGRLKALICTSSLELGIDVGTTDLVIQYNSPRRVARMVQRAGRAGHRIGGRIAAKVIATAPDELMEAMAVARRCEDREVEDSSGRPCPLTVVANQLVAMTMSGRTDRDSAYAVFRRAHPFRDLRREDMDGVLDQLKGIKMLFEDEDGFRRSRKGMDYFYSNISMIPDERSYFIRDIATRAVIGTLDESFVATFEGQNAMFIAKGRTWRVVEMREDEILVEEARDIGSVPSWSGSDIPVPFEVAMEVGRMRRTGDLSAYRCNGNAAAEVRRYIDEQREKWKVPSDRLVTVEFGDRLVIINSCFGTKVNETISKIFVALLAARIGESVGVTTDQYRIILEMPRNIPPDTVMDTFKRIEPGTVEALARMTVLNSSFLKWRFAYVAKKFGIVEKDADHRFMNFGRLFDLHKDTPAYREAVDKVLWEDLDIENTEKAVSMMRSGEIGVTVSTVSPMGMEGITRSKELMQPLRADHSILMALKRRLENEVLYASCLNCAAQWRFRVGDAPRRFVCPRCGGNMIAALKEYDRDKIKLFAADRSALSAEERKDMARVRRIANLVNEDGRKAAMTLAGRGVGPDSASRILRSMHTDEDEFLRDILSAEVLFARNKRFWD